MFTLIKKKDLECLQGKIEDISKKLDSAHKEILASHETLEEYEHSEVSLKRTITHLEERIEEIQNANLISETNQIELSIEDDLTSVTPIVKYNPEIFEKMVELGYLTDRDEGNTMAIQIALLHIGFEALQQIIESLTKPIHPED